MSGPSRQVAIDVYKRPFVDALSCVLEPHIVSLMDNTSLGALMLSGARTRLIREADRQTIGTPHVYLVFNQFISVEEDIRSPRASRFGVRTTGWKYGIYDDQNRELVEFHWHPGGGNDSAHIHVGSAMLDTTGHPLGKSFSTYHIPSDRISIEQVIQFLIKELAVTPRRPDWDAILSAGQESFETTRSWPRNRHSPRDGD